MDRRPLDRDVGREARYVCRFLEHTRNCLDCCFFYVSQIKKPSLSTSMKQIYFQAPQQLEEATRPNLEKKVSDLVENGGEITVTASSLPFNLSLRVTFV